MPGECAEGFSPILTILQDISPGWQVLKIFLPQLTKIFILRLVKIFNYLKEYSLNKLLGYLLQYLIHIDKTMDFKEKLAGIDELVETEYDGCRVFKDIQILVCFLWFMINAMFQLPLLQRIAGSHFDSDGTSLVRLERELPSPSASPFILAVESNRFLKWCSSIFKTYFLL